jgi:hypothetical protein
VKPYIHYYFPRPRIYAASLYHPLLPWTWRRWGRWGVFDQGIRESVGGRLLFVFKGKFARMRAEHRAGLLYKKWRSKLRPPGVAVPIPPPNWNRRMA